MVGRKVLIVRQLMVAMPGEVFVVGFLGSALGMAFWFTGTGGSEGSPAANPGGRF